MSAIYDAGYRKTEAAAFKEYTLQEVIGDAVLSDWEVAVELRTSMTTRGD